MTEESIHADIFTEPIKMCRRLGLDKVVLHSPVSALKQTLQGAHYSTMIYVAVADSLACPTWL